MQIVIPSELIIGASIETLRAQAAIAAMQGMFATPQSNLDAMKHAYVGHECVETLFAEAAVRFADALMAELAK